MSAHPVKRKLINYADAKDIQYRLVAIKLQYVMIYAIKY